MRRLFFVSGLLLFSTTACFLSGSSSSTSNNTTPEVTLSKFQCISGTSQMISSVRLEPQKEGLYSSRSSRDARPNRNYLFFDKSQETVTFTKLLPTNEYLIKQTLQVPEAGIGNRAEFSCNESPETKWLLYLVVNQDTNGDEQLSFTDIPILAMSDISGQNYTELISEIQSVLNIIMKDSQQLMVIYQKDNQYYFSIIDPLKREVTLTEEISI